MSAISQISGRDDFVTFVLGCSFSFEEALIASGLSLRHIEQDTTVPMYRSSVPTREVGPFGGPMVVSMRPFAPDDAGRAENHYRTLSPRPWRTRA